MSEGGKPWIRTTFIGSARSNSTASENPPNALDGPLTSSSPPQLRPGGPASSGWTIVRSPSRPEPPNPELLKDISADGPSLPAAKPSAAPSSKLASLSVVATRGPGTISADAPAADGMEKGSRPMAPHRKDTASEDAVVPFSADPKLSSGHVEIPIEHVVPVLQLPTAIPVLPILVDPAVLSDEMAEAEKTALVEVQVEPVKQQDPVQPPESPVAKTTAKSLTSASPSATPTNPAGQVKGPAAVAARAPQSREWTKEVRSFGGYHSFHQEEKHTLIRYMNELLRDDPLFVGVLPISEQSSDVFKHVADGLLLPRLISKIDPSAFDGARINTGKALNLHQKMENHNLAIMAAVKLGCSVVNIGPTDLADGNVHLTLGLLSQLIRHYLMIRVQSHYENMISAVRTPQELVPSPAVAVEPAKEPALAAVAEPPVVASIASERGAPASPKVRSIDKDGAGRILLQWMNDLLEFAGVDVRVNNFSGDVRDSVVYTHVLHILEPARSDLLPLYEVNLRDRAVRVLENAAKVNCSAFLNADDIVSGHPRLNFAFVANLYDKYGVRSMSKQRSVTSSPRPIFAEDAEPAKPKAVAASAAAPVAMMADEASKPVSAANAVTEVSAPPAAPAAVPDAALEEIFARRLDALRRDMEMRVMRALGTLQRRNMALEATNTLLQQQLEALTMGALAPSSALASSPPAARTRPAPAAEYGDAQAKRLHDLEAEMVALRERNLQLAESLSAAQQMQSSPPAAAEDGGGMAQTRAARRDNARPPVPTESLDQYHRSLARCVQLRRDGALATAQSSHYRDKLRFLLSRAVDSVAVARAIYGSLDPRELPAAKRGFLTKQGGTHKNWKRRYFVLVGDFLLYYKTERDVEPKGCLWLDSADVEDVDEGRFGRRHCFCLRSTANRDFFLCAERRIEVEIWSEVIRSAVSWIDCVENNE
jgi:hypothetical protein